ncbi:MAG TPA: MarR family transcriptional regulator [Mycobacteriales bacterium]|nr:MarR family transcriptional regulator [Mycobacteriales bacterium]
MARSATIDTALASALRLSVVRLNRRLRAQRADTSVTLTQLAALSTLKGHGALTPGELAAHEKVQPPSMTRVLAALEERGLVLRRPHPTDGRQVLVELTEPGRELLHSEVRMREAWLARRLAELSAEEREVLRAASTVIDKLVASE